MRGGCPTEDDLILLLDGEASENRAAEIRAHLPGCERCGRALRSLEELREAIAAPIEAVNRGVDRAARLNKAIQARQAEARQRRPAAWVTAAFATGALAASVAVLGLARSYNRQDDFTARGISTNATSLRRAVGVVVGHVEGRFSPLHPGDTVHPKTAFAVAYRNLGAQGSAHAMVFAVDERSVVHWIQPAFLDPSEDPTSVPLDHAAEDRLLDGGTVLSDPAEGRLRIVVLLSKSKLAVSAIEHLPPAELALDRLEHRFPKAELTETVVVLRP